MYRTSLFWVTFGSLTLTSLTGCEPRSARVSPVGDPNVPVAQPAQRPVTDYVEYTGRTNAINAVTIVPRVTGYLITDEPDGRFPFREGEDVQKGQLLFKIDDRPYKAQLDAARAQVKQNEAARNYAVATNERFKKLAEKQKDAVSDRELDQYQAQEDQAKANLKYAEANLESADLNYRWTKIYAPINGRISRYYLTPGNLVNQDATQLTTLVSMDRMYVYFDMDEPTLLRIKRAINEGKHRPPRLDALTSSFFGVSAFGLLSVPAGRGDLAVSAALIPERVAPDATLEMGLAGEEGYPHKGIVNFIDNQVNAGTGSISVRGIFNNPRPAGGTFLIVPGMFVRVRMPIGQPQQELLVIDRAITSDQGLKSVYVMDAEHKVQPRRVTVGPLQDDGLRVITHGLMKDDWVLVGGLQQVRPGMTIQPDPLKGMPSLVAPAAPQEKAKAKKVSKK